MLRMMLERGEEQFTVADLYACSELVAATWRATADRDWTVPAGTVEWSCAKTAVHAIDCVYAPAFFLASRNQDRYPDVGLDLIPGADAGAGPLVASLTLATRVLGAVVNDAGPDVRAVIFRRPTLVLGAPADFAPRGGLELVLHAHDVARGLGVDFEPPAGPARRLREHTRRWPMWSIAWRELGRSDDAWSDLLVASGRDRG
jgi:hypothetical protein